MFLVSSLWGYIWLLLYVILSLLINSDLSLSVVQLIVYEINFFILYLYYHDLQINYEMFYTLSSSYLFLIHSSVLCYMTGQHHITQFFSQL